MKHFFLIAATALGLAIAGTLFAITGTAGNAETEQRKPRFYRSPMHPWITSPTPGNCTICGMKLAPVFEDDSAADTAGKNSKHVLRLSPATEGVTGVGTAPVRRAPLVRTLRVNGVIREDETRHRVLSARVPGRIEKLFVNQVGSEVVKGQPLVTLYSPDVLTAQRLYIEKLNVGTGAFAKSEIASAREKLLALGLEEADVHRLETSRSPQSTLQILAPFDGTVISRNAYEGQYVAENDKLFEIGELSSLWFIFDAYERDLALLALGQHVSVSLPSLPGEIFTAPISFIDPTLDEQTRTARARVVLDNPKRRILHRQTAGGVVRLETAPVLLAPRSGVLQTRTVPVAFVALATGGYEPRALTLGRAGDEDVEVLAGLREGERIVTQGALLLDNQAQVEGVVPAELPAEKNGAKTGSGSSESGVQSRESSAGSISPAIPLEIPPALLEAALNATEALANDNAAGYAAKLPALKNAIAAAPERVRDILAPLAEKLEAPAGTAALTAARRPFEPFSSALADLVRKQPAGKRPAKIFQCRMTPVQGTARWLQRHSAGDTPRNPFFGDAMLNCGDELK